MPYANRDCTMCGASYPPTGSQQKVCQACAPEFKRQKNIAHLRALRAERGATPVGAPIQCAECGTTFPYSSGPQKRCPECQRKREVAEIHAWLRDNPDKTRAYRKIAKDNYSFDGNREKALERDGYACQRCGTAEDLHVHHKDGRGVTTPREERNNALDNLETLCRGCHSLTHHEERRSGHHVV